MRQLELNKNKQRCFIHESLRFLRRSDFLQQRSGAVSFCLPAVGAEALRRRPGAVGSTADGSPRPLSPGEEEGRPPPSSAALASPSRQEIKSNDGRRSSSGGGGRWRSAAGMARGGTGSKTYRTARDENHVRHGLSLSRRPRPSHVLGDVGGD